MERLEHMDSVKTVIQCDFDGTVTEADASFVLLDEFADGDWRRVLEEYKAGKIPVGGFNSRAFGMVKQEKKTLLDFLFSQDRLKIRPGFRELLGYCSQKGIEFVIVSNGLDFYIEAILQNIGVNSLKVCAARSRFSPDGMKVQYVGPDGRALDDNFKEAYTRLFLKRGYRVIYIGNGVSDMRPAKRASHIFATSDLLNSCRRANVSCTPFNDFNDVLNGLQRLVAD